MKEFLSQQNSCRNESGRIHLVELSKNRLNIKQATKMLSLCAIMIFAVVGKGYSQVANYAFATNATGSLALDANSNTVDMSTGTTQLVAASIDNTPVSSVTNIGFTFNVYGNPFTQFSTSSNGIIAFGSTAVGNAQYAVAGGTAAAPRLSAFGADLSTGTSGKVHYKLVGSSPNRCLVIEFLNMSLMYQASPTNDGTYQVRLYEGTDIVEFVYGAMTRNAGSSATVSAASIGIAGGPSVSVTTSGHSVSYSTFNTNTYSTGTITDLSSASNGSRRVYKFTPATCGSGLSGVKTVGPGGDYTTLTAAINAINAGGISGSTVLELNSTYVSTSESFPITLAAIPCRTGSQTITIRPASGVTGRTITSANTTATVDINGGSGWIIDGRAGGAGASQLTIANTSTATGGSAVRFINDAVNDTIRYATLSAIYASTSSGVVNFSTTTGTTGNDNNAIDNCNIDGGAGVTASPANAAQNGIYCSGSTGSTAVYNSGVTISNCNISNCFMPASASNGINISAGGTDWTITGNSIYQTNSRTTTGSSVYTGIIISNGTTTGNNFIITGNFIGGNSASASGTTTINGTVASRYRGISLAVGTTTATSVQNNTIAGWSVQSSSGATTPPGIFSGIYLTAGNANIGTVTGNTIGSGSGTGSISASSSTSGAISYGISVDGTTTTSISNNIIGSISTVGTGTGISHSFAGIATTAGTTLTINGNTIGGSTSNSINASTASTNSTAQVVTGILNSGSTTISITNNTITNLANAYVPSAANTGRIMGGIISSGGANTITGNTIRNISTAANGTGTTSSASVIGIAVTTSSSNHTVSQNTIHTLTNTNTTASSVVSGIVFTGSTANVVARNFIHSLNNSSASGTINGIVVTGGTTSYQNNMIRLGIDAAGASITTGCLINGISEPSSTGTDNFYHNSVYIGGTGVASGSNNTFAFNSLTTTVTRAFRNNIFVNTRSNGAGTGKHYAIQVGGTAANPAGLTINNNDYLVSGTGGVFGRFNAADVASFGAWQTAVGQDVNSLNVDPLFATPTGTSATVDLHVSNTSPVDIVGAALGVTDDFDGQTRSTLTPNDIGADAFLGPNCNFVVGGTSSPATVNKCVGQTQVLSVTGATSGTGITYQWEISTTSGSGFANVSGGTGATSISYTTAALTAGTFYYRLKVTCTESSNFAYSSESQITVNVLPTVTATPSAASICNPGGAAVVITAGGASTYSWSPATGLSAATGSPVTANPSATTTYTVTGTDGNGCTNTATSVISVGSVVTMTSVTATPSSVCSGGNSQLQATATAPNTSALANTYVFTPTSGTFTPLSGGTAVSPTIVADQVISAVPIGFSFNFNGANYTTAYASTNGFLSFNSSAVFSDNNSLSASVATLYPLIAPLWDDMDGSGSGSGAASYLTTGSSPNRVFTMEWLNWEWRYDAGVPVVSFQVKLYEADGKIELVYRSESGNYASGSSGASIGIAGSATNFISLGSSGASPTTSTSSETTSIATKPASGQTYTFTRPSGASTFSWSPTTFLNNPSIANPLAAGVTSTTAYTVTATTSAGCTATGGVTVTAGEALTCNPITVSSPLLCSNTNFTLTETPTGGGAPYIYSWSTGATTSSIVVNTTAGSHTYTVTIIDACFATCTQEITVNVSQSPSTNVTPSAASICLPGGSPVSLVASGTSTSFSWSPSTGLSATTGTNVTANPSGSTTYTVVGTDATGCSSSATAVVTVAPVVTMGAVTATPSVICSGQNSQLSASATIPNVNQANGYYFAASSGAFTPLVGGTSLSSIVGDDIVSSAIALGFNFTYNGVAYNTAYANSNGWLSFNASSTSVAAASQRANSLASPASGLAPMIAPLWDDMEGTAAASSAASYLTTGTAGNRVFTMQWLNWVWYYGTTGSSISFQAKLYEVDGHIEFIYQQNATAPGSSATASIGLSGATGNYLSLNGSGASPTASNTSETSSIATKPADGQVYAFYRLSSSGSMAYSWSPTTFLSNANISNPVATAVTSATTYTVTATQNGCSATGTASVSLSPGPAVTVQPVSITRCVGTTATFSVTATGIGLTYQWRKNGVDIPVGSNASAGTATLTLTSLTAADAATYDVVVSATCGSPATSNGLSTLTINALPTVAVTPTTGLICLPGGAAIALTSTGATTYAWSPATGLSATTGDNVSANPAITTTYTVTGTDGNGCTNTATSVITVSNKPQNVVATATPSFVCSGGTSNLTSSATVAFTAAQYQFTSGSEATLDPMTGATTIIASGENNAPNTPVAIGFNFNYEGTYYSHFAASPDGFIKLGTSVSSTGTAENANSITSTSNIPKIFPFWDAQSTGLDGNVKYLLSGTSPNRILIVQWFVAPANVATTAASSTFQAWLYEGSGKIEFRYGSVSLPANATASVGLGGATATNYSSVTLLSNTVSTTTANNSNAIVPASGRIYTFTSPFTLSYSWAAATNIVSPTSANTATTALTASETFTVTITSNVGCTATATAAVTVSDAAIINTQPVSSTKCAGQTATFTVAASGVGLTYQWRKNGVDIPVGSNASAITATLTLTSVAAADAATYDVVINSSCGSPVTSNGLSTLTVNALPSVSVTPPSGTICNPGGSAVSLTASGATSYAWSPSTGLSATTGATVSANPTATTNYTVVGTDGNSCSASATVTITVSSAVTVPSVTATPSTVCSGGTSQLSASASVSSAVSAYQFAASSGTFTPLTGATAVSPTIVADQVISAVPIGFSFAFNGNSYTTAYASSNGFLSFNSSAVYSDVNNLAGSATTMYPLIAPLWDDLDGTGSGTGTASYLTTGSSPNRVFTMQWLNWEWNYQASAAVMSFQVKLYEADGKVELVYRADAGAYNAGLSSGASIGMAGSVGNFLSLNNATASPTASNSSETTSIGTKPATGQVYTFTRPTATFSYSWAPSTFLDNPSIANPQAIGVTSSTTYTVTATSNGCSATGTASVAVSSGAVINTQPVSSTKCAGQNASFTVAAAGVGLTYQWRKNGVDIPVGSNATATSATLTLTAVTAADAATYDVVISSTCGSPVTSNGLSTLTVNNLPTIGVTPNPAQYCSPGGPAASLTASGGTSYTWTPSTGLSAATGATVSASPTATTVYTVTGTDASSCSSTTTVTVNVVSSPQVTASATPSAVCSGSNSQLSSVVYQPGSVKITEVTLSRSGTGATSPYPAYATGDDMVEISNISASAVDISGWVLTDYGNNTATVTHTMTFPSGSVIPGNSVAVIQLGGAGSNDLVNRYYVSTGAADNWSSSSQVGVVIKSGSTVIDAVGIGSTYTFNSGTGVVAASWSGTSPNPNTFAGVIRSAATDSNTGADWSVASAGTPQTIGTFNSGYTAAPSVSSFAWTPATFITGQQSLQNPLATAVTAATTYTVVVTSSLGCSTSATAGITVKSTPVVDATTSLSSVCGSDSVQLGAVVTGLGVGGTSTFTTPTTLTIVDATLDIDENDVPSKASLYPDSVIVSGISTSATVQKVIVTGITHTWPADIDMMLVSPTGKSVMLVSDAGSGVDITSATLTFQDGSPAFTTSAITTGTYAPTDLDTIIDTPDVFSSPAPSSTTGTTLASFTGNPNGKWYLYIMDDSNVDAGSISGNFSIVFNTPSIPTYSWTPSATITGPTTQNPKAKVSTPTRFYVTVTDPISGCSGIDSVDVGVTARPKPKLTQASQTICNGSEIFIGVQDTGAYAGGYPVGTTVDWNNTFFGLSPTQTLSSSLSSQFYAVVNINGCKGYTDTTTISYITVTVNTSTTPASCTGSTGTITSTVSGGGVAPYRYVITNPSNVVVKDTVSNSNVYVLNNLPAATYSVVVTSNAGGVVPNTPSCQSVATTAVVTAPSPFTLNLSSTPESCPGLNDGTALATITGGSGNYTILWTPGGYTTASIASLAPGSYSVSVTDNVSGCTGTASVTVDAALVVTFNVTVTNVSCFGAADGSASVNFTGSPVGVVAYEWVDETYTSTGITDADLGPVGPGTYYVHVQDNNNCEQFSGAVVITEPVQIVVSGFTPSSGAIGSSVVISGSGFTGATDVKFNGTSATVFTVDNDGQITATVPVGATSGTISVFVNTCSGTSTGSFTVTVVTSVTFNLNVFIQGFYIGGGEMSPVLFNLGMDADPTACDSITVELRDPLSPDDVMGSTTTLLHIDGTASMLFPSSVTGHSYYVVIKHRNSIETWSKDPVLFSGSPVMFDFTTP